MRDSFAALSLRMKQLVSAVATDDGSMDIHVVVPGRTSRREDSANGSIATPLAPLTRERIPAWVGCDRWAFRLTRLDAAVFQ
jgi:hypothetical protein